MHFTPMTEEQLLEINSSVLKNGEQHLVLKPELLKSLSNPASYSYYTNEEDCITVFIENLIDYHIFLDGNKRTAVKAEIELRNIAI